MPAVPRQDPRYPDLPDPAAASQASITERG